MIANRLICIAEKGDWDFYKFRCYWAAAQAQLLFVPKKIFLFFPKREKMVAQPRDIAASCLNPQGLSFLFFLSPESKWKSWQNCDFVSYSPIHSNKKREKDRMWNAQERIDFPLFSLPNGLWPFENQKTDEFVFRALLSNATVIISKPIWWMNFGNCFYNYRYLLGFIVFRLVVTASSILNK